MTDNRTTSRRPVILCILDGWGYRTEASNNAISLAATPHFDKLMSEAPHALLDASGLDVGLPPGQMGNSEVGHMNIGAGRVVMQDLPRIDQAIEQGEMNRNAALQDMIAKLRQSGGTAHVMGLISPGGVHSHQDHIAAIIREIDSHDVPVRVHAFLDGRDVPPVSAAEQVAEFERAITGCRNAHIAVVSGRYYAMDRDTRWERVAKAWNAMTLADAPLMESAVTGIRSSYEQGITDEFVLPFLCDADFVGIQDGDAVLMANFRADRAREILHALIDPAFDGFERSRTPKLAVTVGLVEYSAALAKLTSIMFPAQELRETLGEIVAKAGKTQLRIAETEKYAHVTFFLNGGEEKQFDGEERILVPSPKVATYDLQPEMSAVEITDKLLAALDSDRFDLVVVNYANPDMVGHTGIIEAAKQAVGTVDTCLGRLLTRLAEKQGAIIITADHGNAETMYDPITGGPHTAHTINRVPVILVGGPTGAKLRDGRLADLAPSLLQLMGLTKPAAMSGDSLMILKADEQIATV